MGVCVCSHHSSSTHEVRKLKLGTYIHTHTLRSWYVFEDKRSKVKVTVSISAKNMFLVITLAAVVTSQIYGRKFASPPKCSLVAYVLIVTGEYMSYK